MNNKAFINKTKAVMDMVERYLKVMNDDMGGDNSIMEIGATFDRRRGYVLAVMFADHFGYKFVLCFSIDRNNYGKITNKNGRDWAEYQSEMELTDSQMDYILNCKPSFIDKVMNH